MEYVKLHQCLLETARNTLDYYDQRYGNVGSDGLDVISRLKFHCIINARDSLTPMAKELIAAIERTAAKIGSDQESLKQIESEIC